MNYAEALGYLYGFTDYEKRPAENYSAEHFSLARVEALLTELGNPHRRFKSVLIAGTKGKGSTAAMLSFMLTEGGFKAGLYTQPHLHSYRERILVDGQMIGPAKLAQWVERVRRGVQALNQIKGRQLTTYELGTAAAFLHFAAETVDIAVLEVGLGGRLDATNVVHPALSIITSISYDHTQILGDSLQEIAAEKAGIIKEGGTVLSAPQADEALGVIRETCEERRAKLYLVEEDWNWNQGVANLDGQKLSIKSHHTGKQRDDLWIPLLGRHQLMNATTAVAAVELLRQDGVSIGEGVLREGLRKVQWPGRLEIVSASPLVVVDGAHNVESARRLRTAVQEYFSYEDLILIVGFSREKDIGGILEVLTPMATIVIGAKSGHPRAASLHSIREAGQAADIEIEVAETVSLALARAQELTSPGDLICVAGSLFVVADAREWFGLVKVSDPVPT